MNHGKHQTPREVAKVRHDLWMRGWMIKKEMEDFLCISAHERIKVWKKLEDQIADEGKMVMEGKMITSRVMKYAGLTEKRIVSDYERLVVNHG